MFSSPMVVPAAKMITSKLFTKTIYREALNFAIVAKALCIWLQRDHRTLQNKGFRELFCNNFGQDGSAISVSQLISQNSFSGANSINPIQKVSFRRVGPCVAKLGCTRRGSYAANGRVSAF